LASCFCAQLSRAGGLPSLVGNDEQAVARVLEIVQAKEAGSVLVGNDAIMDRLGMAGRLAGLGCNVINLQALTAQTARDAFFGADVGISGAAFLIAETGTVVQSTSLHEPRSLSLLPPVHIAVTNMDQVVCDLFDFFRLQESAATQDMPSCISLITGPSKTGDIELRLVTGVHGPREVHVVLIQQGSASGGAATSAAGKVRQVS
jgi:L-lactate dehydrogenase complex protein LldG